MDIEAALAVIDLEIAKLNEARCLLGGETGPSKPPLRRRRVLSGRSEGGSQPRRRPAGRRFTKPKPNAV